SQYLQARIVLPLAGICLVIVLGIASPWLPIPSPNTMDFLAPAEGPSTKHLFGTDLDGRDLFARAVHGARISLFVGLAAPALGLLVGGTLGLLAAYYGGLLRASILGALDVILAFPTLVLALALTSVLGQSMENVTVALGIISIPAFARIARASALPLLTREFVMAARTAGAGDLYILTREILPNMMMPLLTYFLTMISVMIVAEGSLSFLGVGIPPPAPSWGGMIAYGREALERAPHVTLIPAAVMFLTVLSLNLVGDWVRQRTEAKEGALS
ncbi:MAG: ABC transporter permease, partial [Hyphomicrobium sp. SCN 65-11]